ncbi:hypothetical protein, partial [Megasphaera elsdenii]|uniref:hypothetical protein n=1 Tax=Megasphaera elsdenii TaxID=907 RepID=UPI00266F8253
FFSRGKTPIYVNYVIAHNKDVAQKALFFARRLRKMFFPSVETAPLDAHCLAKKLHRNFSG